MRQVTAVRERHAEHRVARLQHGHEDGHVRLRAGVRLDVGVVGAEEPLRPLDREPLGLVDVLAAAVVAPAGIALGVLVGEDRPRRFADRAAGVVLRGDEFEVLALAPLLAGDRRGDLGVFGGDRSAFQHLHGAGFGALGTGSGRPGR